MRYTIKVISINKFREIEWAETVASSTKSGATRMANNIVRSCGHNPQTYPIDKREIDNKHQRWQI